MGTMFVVKKCRTGSVDTFINQNTSIIIVAKFNYIWKSTVRSEDFFLKIKKKLRKIDFNRQYLLRGQLTILVMLT